MIDVALVLEGGSLRSLYTAGVLDVFMENKMEFSCVIGVSAGALTAGNYIAKHIGRSARINLMHSNDPNYFGFRQLIFKKSVFNFDFLFTAAKDLYPYNESAMEQTKQRLIIGATNCDTGEAVYFERKDYKGLTHALQASASIPLMCPPVNIDGMTCLDGGIADPISINKAFAEGYKKAVLVLTRDAAFRHERPSKMIKFLYKLKYKNYPSLLKTMENRPYKYNALLHEIKGMEQEKRIFVIRPKREVTIKKFEKNVRPLLDLYLQGREDALSLLPQIHDYISQ